MSEGDETISSFRRRSIQRERLDIGPLIGKGDEKALAVSSPSGIRPSIKSPLNMLFHGVEFLSLYLFERLHSDHKKRGAADGDLNGLEIIEFAGGSHNDLVPG